MQTASLIPYIASVSFPLALRPMLLKQRCDPFDGARWLFEPKVQDDRALILSAMAAALRGACRRRSGAMLASGGTVLDGELVVLRAEGRPDSDALAP